MALCDQLEEEQENNLEIHETLVSTLLDVLTSARQMPLICRCLAAHQRQF